MNIMTKRGNQDNMVTYEHICDTTDDLANISPEYVTLGSVAIVLKGDAGMETYMATSDKEWIPLALSDGAAAGGISLPEVTTADNGKVLGVVEGEWNKMVANGAGGVFVVHATKDGDTITLDKTWQEIHDAFFDEGRIVVLAWERSPNMYIILYIESIGATSSGSYDVNFDDTLYSTESPSGHPVYTIDNTPVY